MTLTDSRIRKCPVHRLRPRCPACEVDRHLNGDWKMLEVPLGTAEWLLEAARWYDSMGAMTATEFAEAISCDLRETSRVAE